MTQLLIPTNLPLYIQCLAIPCVWSRTEKPVEPPSKRTNYLIELLRPAQIKELPKVKTKAVFEARWNPADPTTAFDPWEKRAEFLRLKKDDHEGLLALLKSVGIWEKASGVSPEDKGESAVAEMADRIGYHTKYCPEVSEANIWAFRKLLENSLSHLGKETGEPYDFNAQIVRKGRHAHVILTTTTFMDALILTLALDAVLGAKVRKCARPDCGVLFANTGGHKKKYCQWYCGHLESVRKARKQSRKAKGAKNGK